MNQAKVEIENQVISLDLPEIVTDNSWNNKKRDVRQAQNRLDKTVRLFLRFNYERRFHSCSRRNIFHYLGIARTEKANHRYDKKLSQSKAFFDHVRDVEWISAFDFNSSKRLEKPLYGFSNTITIVRNNSPRWPILTELVI